MGSGTALFGHRRRHRPTLPAAVGRSRPAGGAPSASPERRGPGLRRRPGQGRGPGPVAQAGARRDRPAVRCPGRDDGRDRSPPGDPGRQQRRPVAGDRRAPPGRGLPAPGCPGDRQQQRRDHDHRRRAPHHPGQPGLHPDQRLRGRRGGGQAPRHAPFQPPRGRFLRTHVAGGGNPRHVAGRGLAHPQGGASRSPCGTRSPPCAIPPAASPTTSSSAPTCPATRRPRSASASSPTSTCSPACPTG